MNKKVSALIAGFGLAAVLLGYTTVAAEACNNGSHESAKIVSCDKKESKDCDKKVTESKDCDKKVTESKDCDKKVTESKDCDKKVTEKKDCDKDKKDCEKDKKDCPKPPTPPVYS